MSNYSICILAKYDNDDCSVGENKIVTIRDITTYRYRQQYSENSNTYYNVLLVRFKISTHQLLSQRYTIIKKILNTTDNKRITERNSREVYCSKIELSSEKSIIANNYVRYGVEKVTRSTTFSKKKN